MVLKAFPDAAEDFDNELAPSAPWFSLQANESPLASCIGAEVSDAIVLHVLRECPRTAYARFPSILKQQQHMLVVAVERGVSDRVAEAL